MKNLNVVAALNRTSFGIVSFYMLKYFAKHGVNVSFFPIGQVDVSAYADNDLSFLKEQIERSKFYDKAAPCLRIFHQFSLAEMIGNGKKVAYSFFELDRLKDNEVHHINCLDKFFVASNWAKEVCLKSGVNVPIDILYPGIEEVIYPEVKRSDGKIKFLVCGKFEVRKLHDAIISAFSDAFDLFDNVQLDLLTYNPFNSKEENEKWFGLIKGSKLAHKVNILNPIQLHSDVLKMYRNYDVFVGLSRAEGFMLPLAEAMKAGCLCIASNNTAMGDYISKDNCVFIKSSGKDKAVDGKWFFGDGSWDKFDYNDVVNSFVEAKHMVENNSTSVVKDKAFSSIGAFDWNNTICTLIERMS